MNTIAWDIWLLATLGSAAASFLVATFVWLSSARYASWRKLDRWLVVALCTFGVEAALTTTSIFIYSNGDPYSWGYVGMRIVGRIIEAGGVILLAGWFLGVFNAQEEKGAKPPE